MVIVVNRKDGTFNPDVSDQLNLVFNGINKKIEDYKVVPLDYKLDVQALSGNSFRAGNLLCVRDVVEVTHKYDTLTKLDKKLNVRLPYEIWTTAVAESGDLMTVRIGNREDPEDSSFYITGHLTEYPQKCYICTDVIIPDVS